MRHLPSPNPRARALALALAAAMAAAPVLAQIPPPIPSAWYVSVRPDGTFIPKHLEIRNGDLVVWSGLGRTDSIAHIRTLSGPLNTADVCFATNASDPSYANPYRQTFAPVANEFTGPARKGLSGIWVLSPYGGDGSTVEIPSRQAEAVTPGITAADGCAALNHSENDRLLYEDPLDPDRATARVQHRYVLGAFNNGDEGGTIDGSAWDPGGAEHLLCHVETSKCDPDGTDCRKMDPDPAVPETIPPGVHYNGLLHSTYVNPDVTGVVLRFNWKDLQYDDAGTIRERWEHLDRELERAIAHGKMVTLDFRAGMFGTPDWIFTDYLVPDSGHAAPWCVNGNCAFASAHASAGRVQAIEFLDYYDGPPGRGCGSPLRIGAPGDTHYRALFKDFMGRVAAHIASDTRWFQAVAHVKVSGANLRSSEAELPHHCDDQYTNTADHQEDPKTEYASLDGDRVLDVIKTLEGQERTTAACWCNTQIWHDYGYTPRQLYDYYAEMENQILVRFFGRKSMAYDLLQDGFPRADAEPGGSFLGDHLYREVLEYSSMLDGVVVNSGYESRNMCTTPTVDTDGDARLFDNRATGAVEYCSEDTAVWPDGGEGHVWLGVQPLVADATFPGLAAFEAEDDEGGRYPTSSEQSETILDQGGNGRFGNPALAGYLDRITGKLFVPQHNGLQPLAQERVELEYSDEALDEVDGKCKQQRGRIDIAAPGQPPEYVADFPIAADDPVSKLPKGKGCPNQWIVNQGSDQDEVVWVPPPPAPPHEFRFVYPPQLTGFQTSNKVRSLPHVESALFNLVYNTNGVFIELYEDAVWRIAVSRGSGPLAAPLDDPAAAVRTPNDICQYGTPPSNDLCYSKNLHQWSEELHRRRSIAADLWSNLGGLSYPALADPYPNAHVMKFVNTSTKAQTHSYINPAHCNPARVDLGDPQNGLPSALGTIRVLP